MTQENIILFGAGTTGRYVLHQMRARGAEPFCFADNDPSKSEVDGIIVLPVNSACMGFPDARWVACAMSEPALSEIRAELATLNVSVQSIYETTPGSYNAIPYDAIGSVGMLVHHNERSHCYWRDQVLFREHCNIAKQIAPVTPYMDIYFPEFIRKLTNEHYVDVGAYDGDTIREFCKRWPNWKQITAFEPDRVNRQKILAKLERPEDVHVFSGAVSDHSGSIEFACNHDWSSHISMQGISLHTIPIEAIPLDQAYFRSPPTFIKMDIEGNELEALWGARKLLATHAPVLAIAAYHTSDHIWQIPMLIHALQPTYRLFLRRYAEGPFETVWYAVPPDRVCA